MKALPKYYCTGFSLLSQIDLGLNWKEFQILFKTAQIHLKHLDLLKFQTDYSPLMCQKRSLCVKTKSFKILLDSISTMNTYHDNSNIFN